MAAVNSPVIAAENNVRLPLQSNECNSIEKTFRRFFDGAMRLIIDLI
jgi:hypothetical protein